MPSHRSVIATYIMASRRNGAIYTGSTVNLVQRVWRHRNGAFEGFTDDHGCHLLVWFERHGAITEAILRERRIKTWMRD